MFMGQEWQGRIGFRDRRKGRDPPMQITLAERMNTSNSKWEKRHIRIECRRVRRYALHHA